MGRLQHKCNQLRLLATCSITITNKQNRNVIDCDYIESNHDYNRDYICLKTSMAILKTQINGKSPKSAKRRQLSENQRNTKTEIETNWGPGFYI